MLEAVKDNSLSNKLVVHAQTILSQMNTNDCINLKIRLPIFNVPKQNDCQRRDRYILCNAQKNLLVVDFYEENMSCFVVETTIQGLHYTLMQ